MRRSLNLNRLKAAQKPTLKDSLHSRLAILAGSKSAGGICSTIASSLLIKQSEEVPTMAVTISDGRFVLLYNDNMVNELTLEATSAVLWHEMGHLLLDHLPRMAMILMEFEGKDRAKAMKVIHYGADYALNSWLIDDMKTFSLEFLHCDIGSPTEHISPEYNRPYGSYRGIHPTDRDLPVLQSLETYVRLICESVDNDGEEFVKQYLEGGAGQGDSDSSDESGESSSEGEGSEGEGSEGESSSEGEGSEGEGSEGEGSEVSAGEGSSSTSSGEPGSLRKVVDSMPDIEDGDGPGPGRGGLTPLEKKLIDLAGKDPSDALEEVNSLRREFKKVMSVAQQASKGRGIIPGSLQEMIEASLREPTINWRTELRRFAGSSKAEKVATFARPSRKPTFGRSLRRGKKKLRKKNILLAIDTSGSVSRGEILEIFAELMALKKMGDVAVTVCECDTSICDLYDLDDKRDLSVKGRGGTYFDPPFELAIKQKVGDWSIDRKPDLLVYATDGEAPMPNEELRNAYPANKVLWLITSRGSVPSLGHRWGAPATESRGDTGYGRFLKMDD
jgi:predicted metal-dependent peptidase